MHQQIGRHTWYDDLPSGQDKARQQAYATWLKTFPWKVYLSLTFAYPVSHLAAQHQLAEFHNRLERLCGTPIGSLFVEETRSWSGCGLAAVPLHYHGLLCSDAPLDPGQIETVWGSMGHFGGNAKADLYDPSGNAAFYCMKFLRYPDSHWEVAHLDFFMDYNGPNNHAARRRARRRAERNSRLCRN